MIYTKSKDKKSPHYVWHKFYNWMCKTYGSDLHGPEQFLTFEKNGKPHKIKFKNFNEAVLNKRLSGYEVLSRMESYVKRYLPEIKIVRCDDTAYAGSSLFLVPHPKHGITILFVPQCTGIQNQFFLYENHYKMLMKGLREMKHVYNDGKR